MRRIKLVLQQHGLKKELIDVIADDIPRTMLSKHYYEPSIRVGFCEYLLDAKLTTYKLKEERKKNKKNLSIPVWCNSMEAPQPVPKRTVFRHGAVYLFCQ